MEAIFLVIQNATLTLVKWCDLNEGQLGRNLQGTYPVEFPCLLIGFEASDFVTYNDGSEQYEATVTVTYAEKHLGRTHSQSGAEQEIGLDFLRRAELVHQKIQLRNGESFSFLKRFAFEIVSRGDLRLCTMKYETTVKTDACDYYIEKISKIPKPPLNVEKEYL